MLERWHSTLKAMRKKSGRGRKEWDLLIPTLLFAYREAMHKATGFSPFELVFGRTVRGPLDLVKEQWEEVESHPVSVADYLSALYQQMKDMAEIAEERDKEAKEKYKTLYDQGTRKRTFKVGDSALVLMPEGHSKLEASYCGPFTVLKQVSPVTYRIDMPGQGKKGRIVHVNLMKEWTMPTANALAVLVVPEGLSDDEGELIMLDLDETEGPRLSDHLTQQQKTEALKLIYQYQGVFCTTPSLTDREEHDIQVGSSRPIRMPPYRIPLAYLGQVHAKLKTMAELGIIEPSKSSWASPLVTVRKKDGRLRLCGDYRCLNQVTEGDCYCMPRPDELLDRMGKARFFTTLDMLKGYYQVPMSQKDREKTAFVTPLGKYQFLRMPFGLKNTPATFQRLVDQLFDGTSEYVAAFILMT